MKSTLFDSVRGLFLKCFAVCVGTVMICMGAMLLFISDSGRDVMNYSYSLLFLYPLYALCYILPIILAYNRFGFLHDRVRRDFYESAPISRSRRFAGEYTAVCIMTVLTVSISYFSVMSFLHYCHFWVFGGALRIYASMLLISLVMCALSVIAVSLTGRFATSFVLLAALTVAVPETLNVCREFYESFGKYISFTPLISFVPPLFYNTLTGVFRIVIFEANICWGTVFTDSSLIITLLCFVVLSAVAYFAFVKFRVNTGDGFCRPALGHVCAALLTLPGMIVVIDIIIGSVRHSYNTRIGLRTAIVLSRILLFFIIEYICFGKIKYFRRTLSTMAVCFAAAIGICSGFFVYSKVVSSMPQEPEYIIVKRLSDSYGDYDKSQRAETISKGLLPDYEITDKELIDEIINYKGNDRNYYISYEACSGNKHSEKFGFISEKLALQIQAELAGASLEFVPRENISYIGYLGSFFSIENASEIYSNSKLFDVTGQKERILDCFYEEYEKLSNEQKAEIAVESVLSKLYRDFFFCLKNGEILRFHLDSDSFPKTAEVLSEIMEKELNDYARKDTEYEVRIKH